METLDKDKNKEKLFKLNPHFVRFLKSCIMYAVFKTQITES